jgi:hypothetical protein
MQIDFMSEEYGKYEDKRHIFRGKKPPVFIVGEERPARLLLDRDIKINELGM